MARVRSSRQIDMHPPTASAMSALQTTGDCNGCHTEAGASGAPGRIQLP